MLRHGSPSARDAQRALSVADDHALVRRGLELVLSGEPDIELVGEAADGIEAVDCAEALAPDVVLMDVRMPRQTGIEAARVILGGRPETRVIMLTVSEDEQDLSAAVRAVALGQSLVPPSMASKLLDEFNVMSNGRTGSTTPRLTDREPDVLRLAARGRTNRQIAETLGSAVNTVKNHVRNVLEKLHLHSRTEALMYAVRERLPDLDDGAPEALR